MRIIHELNEMTETARGWLTSGVVGFVPTTSSLHAGQLALIQAARRECEISVVAIFTDPEQISSGEKPRFAPRDLTHDLHLLESAGVDVVFLPETAELYPPDFATSVTLSGALVERLEMIYRSPYLRSIATALTKLFLLVRPDRVYFAQKDAQHIALMRRVVRDLSIDLKVVVQPTIREYDGLPLSQRNRTLSPLERQAASMLYRALLVGKELIERGERQSLVILRAMRELIATEPLITLAYLSICDPDTFQELASLAPRALLILAANVGSTHLVDSAFWQSEQCWLL